MRKAAPANSVEPMAERREIGPNGPATVSSSIMKSSLSAADVWGIIATSFGHWMLIQGALNRIDMSAGIPPTCRSRAVPLPRTDRMPGVFDYVLGSRGASLPDRKSLTDWDCEKDGVPNGERRESVSRGSRGFRSEARRVE